jgi:hypothetical protein
VVLCSSYCCQALTQKHHSIAQSFLNNSFQLMLQVSLAQQPARSAAAPATATAAAPASELAASLAKSTPRFSSLLGVINLKASDLPKNVVGTIFAPNDAVSVRPAWVLTSTTTFTSTQ